MSRRPVFRIAGAAAALLCLPAAAQERADPDMVVATVNGAQITLGHMIALRERLPEQYDQMPDEALFSGILDQLIQQAALAGRAGEPPRSVDLTVENERRALLAREALADVADEAITDEALQAAYDRTFGGVEQQTEYNASHILVETEDEARQIVQDLQGGADFAALARERSTGPSGPSGGELGWFGSGVMVPEFEAAVTGLTPGEVSQPLQTQFGWHVVKLNDVREQAAPPLDAVREEIEAQVRQQAVEEALAEAAGQAEVDRADVSGIDPSVLSDQSLID